MARGAGRTGRYAMTRLAWLRTGVSWLRRLYLPLFVFIWLGMVMGELCIVPIQAYSKVDFRKAMDQVRDLLPQIMAAVTSQTHSVTNHAAVTNGSGFHVELNATNQLFELKLGSGDEATKPKDAEARFVDAMALCLGQVHWMLLFLVPWLWPVYRYQFSRAHVYSQAVERRIVSLPWFIMGLIWTMAAVRFALEVTLYHAWSGTWWDKAVKIDLVSFFLYGTLISYFNFGITLRYATRKIAAPVFAQHDPYGFRSGHSIGLATRILMLLLTLGMIPMLINLYLPWAFNAYRMRGLLDNTLDLDALDLNIFLPLLAMSLVTAYFFIAQILALFSARRAVIGPLNVLIRQMRKVGQGDFTTQTPVLGNDELEQLKAHFNRMVAGLQERERIRDTFGKFVSLEIAEKIMGSGQINLSGEEIECTVMFVDIRGFTPLCETLPPDEIVTLLNSYFTHITPPIMEARGVINKFIGDAVLAIFAPGFGVADHAAAGLRAGLGVRHALARFNASASGIRLQQGIGLHSGRLVAGNVGTAQRMEYTVIGDPVNMASRIETETRALDTDLLVSEPLLARVDRAQFPGCEFVPYEGIVLKGVKDPVRLFGVREISP